jgi:hypothetical protein
VAWSTTRVARAVDAAVFATTVLDASAVPVTPAPRFRA